jgi:hypothetical protein
MQSFTFGLLISYTTLAAYAQSPSHDELMRRLKINQSLYQQHDYGESLISRQERTNADVIKNIQTIDDIVQCTTNCTPAKLDDNAAIKSAAKFSDVTVVGHVVQSVCAMTKRGAFLYTDSELVVDEVLLQRPASVLHPQVHEGDEITVTEPGGKIRYGNHTIEVNDPNRKRLKKDKSYLLFLKYLPESQSYKTIGLDGYDVSDQIVLSLSPPTEPLGSGDLADRSSFLAGVHNSMIKVQVEATK